MTIITAEYADDGIEVTGIVPGRTDPDAQCELAVSKGSVTRSASAAVSPTGGNSYCPLLVIPRSELSTGEWRLVLIYTSAATGAGGTSDEMVLQVP